MGHPKEDPRKRRLQPVDLQPDVLGMDYLDCSHQTLSLIDFKLKDHTKEDVNLHGGHVSFSIIFLEVTNE